jgi:hypothetical protein
MIRRLVRTAALACAVAHASTACANAQPILGATDARDAIGLRSLLESLSLFPVSLDPHRLTLKQYESLMPHTHPAALGPFGVAYSLPPRADSLTVQVAFAWNVDDVTGTRLSDDPPIASVYLGWSGSDAVAFDSLYRKIRGALRRSDTPPVCVDLGTNLTTPVFERRSREALWQEGGWVAELFLRASIDSVGKHFLIQYRASRDSVLHVPAREPKNASWACLPEMSEVIPIRR